MPLVGARFLGRESPRSTSAGTSATGTSRPWLISGQLLAEDRAYEVTEGPGAGGGLPRQRRSRPGPGNGPFGSRGGARLSDHQISGTTGVLFALPLPLFRAPGARCPGEVSSWVPPSIMRATFGHPPAEGPETYARERDPGRGSATGSRKVVPPAGPSHLTPSRPGEAKSRSDEAPRCPNQNRSPNHKTAACAGLPEPGASQFLQVSPNEDVMQVMQPISNERDRL